MIYSKTSPKSHSKIEEVNQNILNSIKNIIVKLENLEKFDSKFEEKCENLIEILYKVVDLKESKEIEEIIKDVDFEIKYLL